MDNTRKLFQMIGLAKRAGKIASGAFLAETAIKSHRAYLVVAAQDASEGTKKKFQDMCRFRQIPFYLLGDQETIGSSLGQEMRSVLAVTDPSFANALIGLFTKE